ncbi:C-GCAxxG-C-C family (seleno)protein [Megamonas hypermegale]|uniref:C-GCAxxG-C-C family (seleno)protein n=1 Tax=Megamonas hypermegale TaxID=158847 RepID=UPI0026EEBD76|nr:C-GCAxxG-C-C family (seleno)protein [Megamonas hypermegale]
MLKDLAAKYYQQGYNCAETIIRAGNEYYNLRLDENAFRITGAFGGGLQVGDVCGALTGSACVVSAKYIETKAHDCPDLKPLMLKLVRAFQTRFSSRLCAQIKAKFHNKEVRCLNTVTLAAEVLEQVIAEYEQDKQSK